MASSNICSNPTRKLRVIGKIRGSTDQESESCSAPWIFVNKHEGGLTEKVTISFGDKLAGGKHSYDMDYCYEQNEDFCLIFSREIKPLISGVLDGRSASIIAYGARGSGKTFAIQGSEDKPGLAAMAMTEILSMAEENRKLIKVSFYEVFHDHVYDLLDSNHPEIQVFENAQGKIELKGLSQVAIKSISEFHKLYFSGGCNSWKAAEKIGLKVSRRSHKGLMIHISSHGKMNFVDLAGYEDARRIGSDSTNLGESSKINKSLYAFMNVVYALNTNEKHVPYRESKLTRVLQEAVGGTNRVLLLTCLNSSFCQDTMYIVSLASRSFRVINYVKRSGKRNGKPATASSTMKKEATSGVITSGKKLFDDGIPSSTTSKQAKISLNSASAILPDASLVLASRSQKEVKSTADVSLAIACTKEIVDSDIDASNLVVKEDDIVVRENQSSLINEESPPLSTRLRELSNNMKTLYMELPSVELQRFQRPPEMFNNPTSGMKHSLVKDYLQFLNSASKEELRGLKGIGEKRATYILELREESPEPFKNLDDLQNIGLSTKQIKNLMKNVAGELFS